MRSIQRPSHGNFYPEREADLVRALRPHFLAAMPDGDLQRLTLAAFHSGWGLTEIGHALERLKAEWRMLP